MPVFGGQTGTSAVVTVIKNRTTGSMTLDHTQTVYVELAAASGGPGTGGLDLVIAAAVGDVLEVAGNFLVSPGTAGTGTHFDFATIVSGAPVNWLGLSGGTKSNDGLAGWRNVQGTNYSTCGPPFFYTVVSGDRDGSGNVTLRLYYAQDGTNNSVLAITGDPFQIAVKNLRH